MGVYNNLKPFLPIWLDGEDSHNALFFLIKDIIVPLVIIYFLIQFLISISKDFPTFSNISSMIRKVTEGYSSNIGNGNGNERERP